MTARPKILIAEDETLVRLDLRALLEDAGFEVCAAARDGEEAVELAREQQPDAALLDVKMPRLDGIEAARRILAERWIPIVMLTAYGYGELISRALDTGVFGYIVKPFRPEDVVQAVRAAAERREMAVDLASADGQSTWPLSFVRRPDGQLDVTLRENAP
jgi:CheY-like chemotaxis protein